MSTLTSQLLNRRVEAVNRSAGAAKEAKLVVGELKSRLTKEMEERESEAALYSAKLYQSEQKQSDWYVEKRLMEQKVAKLTAEVQERDKLDAQIESCVCTLFDRMKLVETVNARLTAQLQSMGLVPVVETSHTGES